MNPRVLEEDAVLRLEVDFARFDASRLFAFFTQPETLRSWWVPHPSLEAWLGGDLDFHWPRQNWHLRGRFTRFEPPAHLEFTWRFDHEPHIPERDVHLRLEPLPDMGTKLHLTHGGYTAEDVAERQGHLEGWQHFLGVLWDLEAKEGFYA